MVVGIFTTQVRFAACLGVPKLTSELESNEGES